MVVTEIKCKERMSMVVARVKCNAIIRNIPEDIVRGTRRGFIVVRVDRAVMWYYGCYESDARAMEVAEELGNGIVLSTNLGEFTAEGKE